MTEAEWIVKAKAALSAGVSVLERHAGWAKDAQEKTALLASAQILESVLAKAPK